MGAGPVGRVPFDPRNGETFYVGKGRGDRVFEHIREQVGDDPSEKLRRIRDIHLAGFEVRTSSTATAWTRPPPSRSKPP